ncbi:MAG: cytochrome c [Anaerolineae bacterium]|nr:cytochrome c [Anaerolineae bacterium]MCO5204822.1 cytochrome c [Anaerolineae bacterium]
MKKTFLSLLVLVLALVMVACGGGDDSSSSSSSGGGEEVAATGGDAAAGEELYKTAVLPSGTLGCSSCHSLEPDTIIVGPSHAGLANRAGEYEAGVSAEQYLRTSIMDPNDHLVEGFSEGVMPQTYAEELTPEQIDNLVAYLLTLK